MFQSLMIGVGLAMDASCVSMTNGLSEKNMKWTKILFTALLFGIFQMLMPVIGYFAGGLLSKYIDKFIPIIALILLSVIGSKMIIETLRERKKLKAIAQEEQTEEIGIRKIKISELFVQAIATSIDALSVGIIFVEKSISFAMISFAMFGIVTIILCIVAVFIGKKFGLILKDKANIIGGLILIAIGLKIFIEYMLEAFA